MKFILGRKINMTQLFDESGRVTPVTVIVAHPNTVTKVKTVDSDGYTAVQVGTEEQKTSRVNKAQLGQFGGQPAPDQSGGPAGKGYKEVQEFRVDGDAGVTAGDVITVETFEKGDKITVSGISKAKGFQGVVKRHGFHGGPRSHGQKHSEREPGSIGGGLRTRVPKGMRMAGRTGGEIITVKGLKVVAVDVETNTLYISGAVPGRRGTVVAVTTTK